MNSDELLADYVGAFARRSERMMRPGEQRIDLPGLIGAVSSTPDQPGGRLLAVDDRASSALRELLPHLAAHVVSVLDTAPECQALLHSSQRYSREHATAMVCPDLAGVPRTDLPNEFTVHRVRRLPDDDASGVPVEQAAAACMRAEADIEGSLEGFVGFLRSLPAEAHLFAATDASGEVRATSASGCFGEDVNAFFVSTDPQWRGRGVASAMTSLALRDARDRGGTRACLDASSAGHNIYTRLGFHDVCPVTLFHLHD